MEKKSLICAFAGHIGILLDLFYMNELLPFHTLIIQPEMGDSFQEGHIISTFESCGVFLCTSGEVEILFGERKYHLSRGDMYIYVPSTIVRVLHRSPDTTGMLIEVDMAFILPLVTASLSVANLLNIRQAPCTTLSAEAFQHLLNLTQTFHRRMVDTPLESLPPQQLTLMQDILKSMGQTLFYEVINLYYTNRPLQPLPQGKKDLVFHHFMVDLFRYYRSQREVSFYAAKQCIDARYFSSIIKEKSGSTPLQWIVQMVITDARQLLESSDLSIKEVAAKLNFPTQTFFGKYFKQYVGISPKEYRQRGCHDNLTNQPVNSSTYKKQNNQ